MSNILLFPDVYQEQGHWLPAISLAEALRNKGHEVRFMGIADCKAIVEPYKFTFNEIFQKEYPFGYTKSNQHRSVSERWKPVHLWNIMNGGLYKLMNGELDVPMNGFKPDLIISGYFASLETLLMHYKCNKPFMILTTYLRHPDDDPGIRGIQNLVGMSDAMSRKIMESVYSGDIPLDELTIDDFVKPLEQAIELVPCPREFEFSNYIFDSDINPETGRVKFIEPCVERRKKCKHCKYYKNITICEFYAKDNKDYEVLEDCENYEDYEVNWELGIPAEKLAGKRIIFATAGSQVQDYKDKARRWFQEMILMMDLQGMQDYHLVISVGSDLIKENWTLPSNVTRFSWVPQLSVLAKSAVAYIHGGLATVKECIYMGVPFVILSLGKDQMDNALRVRRLGIGAVSFAESVSFSELQNLFLHATTNAWTKTKLEKMKFIFEQMELCSPGVRLIDNYLNELNA